MRGDQLARQWRLIQKLARNRYGAQPDALAAELGVTRRTVYRDLNALMYAGFPISSETRAGGVRYGLLAGFDLSDTPFTPDELLALAFGEDLLAGLEGTVFHDSIHSALEKIRAGLGPRLLRFLRASGEAVTATPGPHKRYREQRKVIQVLNQAVIERRRVRLHYSPARSADDDAADAREAKNARAHENAAHKTARTQTARTQNAGAGTREFDPYRVWYRSGALYAVGHDHKRAALRTFAVDRIARPQLLARKFTIPASFDFAAHTAGAFGVVTAKPVTVCVRFAPRRARYVREHVWHKSQRFTVAARGALDLRMEVGASEELRAWLLSFGADAEVLAPKTLRATLSRELARARAKYR